MDILHNLGFGIHHDKCSATPSQSAEFLGTPVNNRKMQFDRLAKKSAWSSPTVTVRKFSSLLGKLNALSSAAVSAQLHLSPLHHLMRQQLARARYQDLMHLNSQVIKEMQWWHNEMHNLSSKAIISARCQMVLTTNASSHG